MKSINTKFILIAPLTGGILLLTSPGIGFASLAWFALVPLLALIRSPRITAGKACVVGFATGMIYFTFLLSWITIVLGHYGHLPLWITIPALIALASYMSLYPAIFSYLTARTRDTVPLFWFAPLLWVGLDALRNRAFSGFPWMDLAYTQYSHPFLIQVADLAGHHGVTFLIVMVNCLIIEFSYGMNGRKRTQRPWPLIAAVALVLLAMVYSPWRYREINNQLAKNPTMSVGIIQGNIAQGQKWRPEIQLETLDKYLSLSRRQLAASPETDLLIWPETALPFYLQTSSLTKFIRVLTEAHPDLAVLTGAPRHALDPSGTEIRYYNSAFLIDDQGLINDRYDKRHLVPFGEYIPMKPLLPFLGPLVESVGDFTPGTSHLPIIHNTTPIGVLICFESIFPELARTQSEAGAKLLVNLTNDAWFGLSGAPWQHLSMAVFRAVENRRGLARAANTGISGFIDPLGNLSQLSPLFADFSATSTLPVMAEKTFFTFLGGHYFGFICLCLATIICVYDGYLRKKRIIIIHA
ncbi:MAG: apolipoprotein N-acyltransferase [Proteobacteria bacterium]|nr:apolipoprotein N-acyltransferase [Pseudomonadota bacterium]MBU1688402.1 apolipoprotein N-acyltransferase [Pseudomonadota bacterium]